MKLTSGDLLGHIYFFFFFFFFFFLSSSSSSSSSSFSSSSSPFFFSFFLFFVVVVSQSELGGYRITLILRAGPICAQVVTIRLRVMALTEQDCGKNAGEWFGDAERSWKQSATEGRKTKEEMDMKETHSKVPEVPRQQVNPLKEALIHHGL